MARPANRDPLDRFRWAISIEGFGRLGFTSCEVPSYNIQTKSYPEAGQHLFPKQIVDSITYKPVSFERGVTVNMDFNSWAKLALETSLGKVNGKAPIEYRKTVKIEHMNRRGEVIKVYTLINAFPIEYQPASTFSSDGDDVLSIERLVLTYEGFTVEDKNKNSNPVDVVDIVKRMINRS